MNNHANSRRAGCRHELHDGLGPLAGAPVVEPAVVVVRMVFGYGSALTGRFGRHSTVWQLLPQQAKPGRLRRLVEGVGRSYPRLVLAAKGASQLVQLATLGHLGPGEFQRASVLRTRFVYPATVRVARAQPSTMPAQLAYTKNQPNWALALGPQ